MLKEMMDKAKNLIQKEKGNNTRIEDEKKLINEIMNKCKDIDNTGYERQWYLNIAYYSGKQWLVYDNVNNRLYEPPKDPWKQRITANRIQPIVRVELAKITKNKPIVVVVPASTDDEDVDSAKTSEKALEWAESELDLQNQDREVINWGLCTGMCFVKPFWNREKGDDIEEGLKTGDIDIELVSPFEVKFDPSAKRWKEVKWVVHEKVRTTDYVKAVYGKDVEAEKGLYNTNIYETQLKNVNANFQVSNTKQLEDSVKVLEYWGKPCHKYPKGRRITITGDTLLFYDEDIGFGKEDDTERELPFFPFFHIKIPGRVHGQSIIEQLMPIQKEYNMSRSQVINHKNLMGNPQWLVETGSLVTDITDEPGSIIEYRRTTNQPIQSNVAPISSDVYRNIDQCVEEFYFISGQQEVSHGGTPTGVKSGVAIQFLQEQDDTKLGPSIQNWYDCKKAYMGYILKMMRYMYTEPRMLKVVGKDNKVEMIEFMGNQITSLDVRLQEGSMFQQSRAAKQDFIFQLLSNGVLNPQVDRDLILKMLELGITDEMYTESNLDQNQAHSEELMWNKGDTNTITRDFFNHQIHIIEHNKYRKREDYKKLQPDMQSFIDNHVMEHVQYIQQAQQPMDQGQETQSNGIMDMLSDEQKQQFINLSPEEQARVMQEMGV